MKTIGVAVVGTGFGQKVHIPGFQEHPQTQLIAVYHRNLDKAEAIAAAHAIPYACDRLEDLFDLPNVDAVSISTPPFLHYDMAKQCLEAGKHILLEKPMTLNAAETRELYRTAAGRCIATPDFEYRCVPSWQRLAELLAEGYVGQKRLVKIDWLMSSRANPTRPWNWYAQKDKGGGALGALGSHTFDYIHWLFGPAKRLLATLTTTIPERPDPTENNRLKPVDADDACAILLELADGTPCQVSISSVAYQGRGHWVEVYGSEGTLVLGSSNQKDYVHGFQLWGSKAGEPLEELAIPDRLQFPKTYADGRLAPFIGIVDRWVRSITTGEAVAPTLREGVYSQLLMDLTHASNEGDRWVEVPDLDSFVYLR